MLGSSDTRMGVGGVGSRGSVALPQKWPQTRSKNLAIQADMKRPVDSQNSIFSEILMVLVTLVSKSDT